VFMVLK